jgi:hypothetical protein
VKLAVRHIARGERTRIPDELAVYLVAAAFGTTPAAVREWPADEFLFARGILAALR